MHWAELNTCIPSKNALVLEMQITSSIDSVFEYYPAVLNKLSFTLLKLLKEKWVPSC